MPARLLASIRQLAGGTAPEEDAWGVLLRALASMAARLRASRRSGSPPSMEPVDVVQDFVADQLLADGRAGLKYVAKTALTENDATAILRTMLRRHVFAGEPGLLANKRRTLRAVLAKPKYHALPGYPDTHGPAGNFFPPPGDGEFAARLKKWIRGCPVVEVVRGAPDSSQLPLIAHAADIERVVDYLFAAAGTCLRFDQIFAFVARALDLVHWDSVYRLQLAPPPEPAGDAPIPEAADPAGDPSRALAANLDGPALAALAAERAGELTPIQRAYLLFKLDHDQKGESLTAWLKKQGLSRSTFYEREHASLSPRMTAWRAEHPELPAMVLRHLHSPSAGRGGGRGKLTHKKGDGRLPRRKGRRPRQGDSTE